MARDRAGQVDGILAGLSSPSAREVLVATKDFDPADVAAAAAKRALGGGGGGGSQPGVLSSADVVFTERTTAGTYSAALPITAGALIQDVLLQVIAGPWAADTAVFAMGDTEYGAGAYYNNVDLVGDLNAPYNPMNVPTGSTALSQKGNDFLGLYPAGATYGQTGIGIPKTATDTLTLTVVTTIAVPPVAAHGVLRVKVLYFAPSTAVAASFA